MIRLYDSLRHRDDPEAGLTIVEVMVAMLVFALITVGAIVAIGTVLTMTGDNRSREIAANLASQDIDAQRALPDVFDVVGTPTSAPIVKTLSGTKFTLVRSVAWTSTTGITSQCGAAGGALFYRQVNVTVTWGSGKASQTVTSNTLIAPNSKINDPAYGTILVNVQSGVGLGGTAGVSVVITPTDGGAALGTQPDPTDVQGCAYALKVAPGAYNVAISYSGGQYRNQKQKAVDSTPVTVGAGGSASANFVFDPAADLDMNYVSNYTAQTATLPTNLSTTFLSNLDPYVTSTPAADQYVSPTRSGYQAIAGQYAPATSTLSCLSVDPAAWPKASDGAVGTRSPLVAALPGDSPDVNVQMGVVQLNLGSSTTVKYVTAALTTPMGDDPGCNIPQSYTYAVTPTKSNGTYSVNLAIPFGTWTLTTQTSASSLVSPVLWTQIGLLTRGTSALALTLNKVTLDPRVKP